MQSAPLTRRSILAQAWPIMLGQTTVPLVGLVDTAVIGWTGDAAALAGVALGTAIISFIFWAFGFLRMGMTGLTAQAHGRGAREEVDGLLVRGVAAGLGIGVVLVALQIILVPLAFALLAGGGALDDAAREFVTARFLGAPAALGFYAINGWLLGLGRTRETLALQILVNLVNAVLDMVFVWQFGMGARGVGLGTAIAEWVGLVAGIVLVARIAGPRALLGQRAGFLHGAAWKRLFAVNADIMVRTIALLTLFLWLANAGARLGTVQLAANHVLMQLVSIFAFVLDGFAFTAESRVGQAVGRGSRGELKRAIRLTGEFSLGFGLLATLAALVFGGALIDLLTTNEAVRAAARAVLPLAALAAIVGVPAWLLDGVFIGATRGRALRNAAILATALYIATDLLLRPFGATGLWLALLASYGFRAGLLAIHLPRLFATVAEAPPRS
ncbi:MATE family efflux transporter [Sphingomonas sp. R647]|uniref:MATE family efflux transporter n=1 Tax=Sphingomonas sp. R647 TaxID=2875233 RepID=UPI001CD70B16|nr:MATE family efflux transporter [Sphingomonas sp. R647]MCA1197682.1 MATE family efflux transporter [Sphingomonas sp. R647]